MYAVYSCENEGDSSENCYVVDIHPDVWSSTVPHLHIKYRDVWPGSIIHMAGIERSGVFSFDSPKWHLGER